MTALRDAPLLAGLDPAAQAAVVDASRLRRFAAGESLCRAGEPGDAMFIIERGVAHVVVEEGHRSLRVAVVHPGDVIGELSLLTGVPRSATVVAAVPTTARQLDRESFAAVLASHPAALANLSQILASRLHQATATGLTRGQHGEAVGVVVGPDCEEVAEALVAATAAASPGTVTTLGRHAHRGSADGPVDLTALDEELATNRVVLLWCADAAAISHVLPHVDRTLVLARPEAAEDLCALSSAAAAVPPELVLVGGPSDGDTDGVTEVVRHVDGPGADVDIAWLGRHLARTKVGLALGAGGAKGYAHVGALEVLEEAGCTIDAVAGSSIGAIVGAMIAMGRTAADIATALREVFTAEAVQGLFTLSLAGTSTGADTIDRIAGVLVGNRTFDDLPIPLVVMAVDLDGRARRPIQRGRVRDALVAATALAGLVPPVEFEGQRLVDALPLAPVPVTDLPDAHTDVRVAVNLLSHEALPAWPDEVATSAAPSRRTPRLLETLLAVMELAQTDLSERQAAEADVTISPVFGPGTWRDFHLADHYQQAGRVAAEAQRTALADRVPSHVRSRR